MIISDYSCPFVLMSDQQYLIPVMKQKQITPPKEHEHLLSEQQVAELLNISVQTLRRWRRTRDGIGAKYIRIGRFARYRPRDVQAYIESRMAAAGK